MAEHEKVAIQLQVDPSLYMLTSVALTPAEDGIILQLNSASQVKQYFASSKHAKQILALLQSYIADYESTHGELIVQTPSQPPMRPPIGFSVPLE